MRSLVAHALVWIGICASLAAISSTAPVSLHFLSVPPIPLRANPILLTAGIALGPVSLALLYVASRYSLLGKTIIQVVAISAATVCFGFTVLSLHAGAGSIVARDLVAQPDAKLDASVFAVPVFFDNSRSELDNAEITRLDDLFSVFRLCETNTISIRGFASSAEYPKNSNALNLKLANDRAVAVKKILDKLAQVETKAVVWELFEDMLGQRRLRDTTPDGELIRKIERYNRRAEIFWTDNECLGLAASALPKP